MKLAVYGSGAVGSYFGFLFQSAGFQVDFIARGESLEALRKNGLFVEGFDRPPISVEVSVKEKLEGEYDVIFICVKSKDTIEAAKAVKGHFTPGGFAVSLQNGVENADMIESVFEDGRTVPAVIYMTAMMPEKGRLKYMSHVKLIFGVTGKNAKEKRIILEDIFTRSGINYSYNSDVKTAQWKKLLLNVSVNPLTALLGLTFGGLLNDERGRYLAEKLFNEAKAAAVLNNVGVNDVDFDFVLKQCLAKPEFKTSMLQDVEAGNKPETDAILGAVVRSFEKVGKTAPYADQLLKIMDIKYGGWFQSSPRLAADVLVVKSDGRVLLIERKNPPYGWAIPGGFVDMYESIEHAASRELKEETGIDASYEDLELLGIYSDPARDPRGHTVSAVYVYFSDKEAVASDDAENADFFYLDALPENIAFDHRKVLRNYRDKYGI